MLSFYVNTRYQVLIFYEDVVLIFQAVPREKG